MKEVSFLKEKPRIVNDDVFSAGWGVVVQGNLQKSATCALLFQFPQQ